MIPSLTKLQINTYLIYLNTFLIIILFLLAIYLHSENSAYIKSISQGTAYACVASKAVNILLKDSIIQINQGIKNGEYVKLYKEGIYTKHDLMIVHEDLKFETGIEKLLATNTGCNLK